MILRRVLKYGIVFLCLFFVISCISLYEHKEILSEFFSSSLSSAFGVGLYVLIFVVGFVFMLRPLFK